MAKKEKLMNRLKNQPNNFTIQELDKLMSQCGCDKKHGAGGSSLRYVHKRTKRVCTFHGPHPGNELYNYQIKKVLQFLEDIEEDI